MAKGRIKVIRAIPGSTSLTPILRDFEKRSGGIVTAFSESMLPICRHIVEDASTVDVMPFGELVRNVLVLSGEEVLPLAQRGQKAAAVSFACSQLEEESPFNRSSRFPGFHEAVLATLDELRHWGIDAGEMDLLASVTDGRLSAKLSSLAKIDRDVVEILGSLGRQLHADQLAACFDSVVEMEGTLNRLLVVVGSEEDPLRIRWLKWIARAGVDVTIVFDRHATDAPIFARARNSIALLGANAVDAGDGNRLTRNLFAGSTFDGPQIGISIVSAADPLAEAEWALRACLEQGDLLATGIFVRDLEGYAPLIESAAKRFELPLQMARRAPLLTNSFGRLTLSALRFCASDDVRTLSPILRSSYLHLSGNAQHALDMRLRDCYVQRAGQWRALEGWANENAEDFPWLQALLVWRNRLIEESLKLPEWFGALKELNREQKYPWVNLGNKGGAMDERDRRALNQMERLLVNHISVDQVTHASSMSFRQFVVLCERLWSEGDVSIPSEEDGIRVTSDPDSIGEVENLVVLGMLEGVFPRRRSEDPILTDAERLHISELRPDGPPLADSRTNAQGERDEFYKVCASARSKIVFSYPLADDQRDNIRAFYLTEIERVGAVEKPRNYPRRVLAPDLEQCVTSADSKLRSAIDGPRQAPASIDLTSEPVRSAIRPSPDAAFEPEVLRHALQCPFQYLVQHVLKIKVKRQTARWNTLQQLPQSALLLSKVDLADAEKALNIALNAQLDQLYAEVPEWEMRLLRAGGQRLIRDWLHRESKSRRQWSKTPGSVRANVPFGTPGARDKMPGDVKLEGVIAGVSKMDRYNVAHLYGTAVESPKDLTDTDKLYLGLHLLAIHEPGREGAIEIESMTGKRSLLVLGRGFSQPLASSVADGLQVLDLATSDDLAISKKVFYDEVKRALKSAVLNIVDVRVDPIKGDHCDWCDYGELCRRSRGFGEEDSPFGEDTEFDDG